MYPLSPGPGQNIYPLPPRDQVRTSTPSPRDQVRTSTPSPQDQVRTSTPPPWDQVRICTPLPPGTRSEHLPPSPLGPGQNIYSLPPGTRSEHLPPPPPPGTRSEHLPPPPRTTRRWAVSILLECILVGNELALTIKGPPWWPRWETRGGSRISVGGGANPPAGAPTYNFYQVFQKSAWNWENFDP